MRGRKWSQYEEELIEACKPVRPAVASHCVTSSQGLSHGNARQRGSPVTGSDTAQQQASMRYGHCGPGSPAERAGRPDSPAPVERWNPPYCGDIGMAIRADGVWLYQGSPIGRMPLVKLFARVLRRDADGRHYLVTPAEKVDVAVADAPFLAVEMAVEGSGRRLRRSPSAPMSTISSACGPEHPLRFVEEPRQRRPEALRAGARPARGAGHARALLRSGRAGRDRRRRTGACSACGAAGRSFRSVPARCAPSIAAGTQHRRGAPRQARAACCGRPSP